MSNLTLINNKYEEAKDKIKKEYLEYLKEEYTSKNTIETYYSIVEKFLEFHKGNFTYLNRKDVIEYKEILESDNLAPASFNQKMSILKNLNKFLIEKGIQKELVIIKKDFRKIQKRNENPNVLNKEQVETILNIIKNHNPRTGLRDACIVACLAYGGVRISEALSLKKRSVDIVRGLVSIVKAKGNKDRDLEITASLERWLVPYLEQIAGSNQEYLFESKRKKSKIGKSYVNHLLKKDWLIEELPDGYPELHPHAFRHFCGTYLLNSGVWTITDVQNFLGHQSITTTQIYTQDSKENRREKAKQV